MEFKACPDCHAAVPDIDGESHAYLGAPPGCWKLYGELLAREYNDPTYFSVHRLTVDAYAAQHPGMDERRANQSVIVHLVSLYLILEQDLSYDYATHALGRSVEALKEKFHH